MRWNLRMVAAERGIWKSTELRRQLADAGLEISAGKMSGLWTGTPTSVRLDDLDVICSVLSCNPDRPADHRTRRGRRPPPGGSPTGVKRRPHGHPEVRAQSHPTARVKRRSPLRRCMKCRTRPVSWTTPRVDCCYECLPGGPFTPPACSRCGSKHDYFTNGLCARCHLQAPQPVGSCMDCHGWGVIRKTRWLCWGCTSWRQHATEGTCRICAATVAVNPDGVCRLCRCQHILRGGSKGGISVEDANRDGQQLFLANLHYSPAGHSKTSRRRSVPALPRPVVFHPVGHRQLLLFDLDRDLVAGRARGFNPPALPRMARFIEQVLTTHAAGHGWGKTTTGTARQGMAIVLSLQDTPGAPITATEIMRLQQIGIPASRLIDICEAAELLDDDRIPAVHAWVSRATRRSARPDAHRTAHLVRGDAARQHHPTPPTTPSRKHHPGQPGLGAACPAQLGGRRSHLVA